jgi:hypothetical protein
MNDIYFKEEHMPCRIRAYVAEDVEGDYTVVVNDYLSDEALQRAVKHELAHIKNADTYSDEHFSTLERLLG